VNLLFQKLAYHKKYLISIYCIIEVGRTHQERSWGMELELHYCHCLGNHSVGHCKAGAGCNCFCFRCSQCRRWISKRHWPEHQGLADCTPSVPPRPDERAEEVKVSELQPNAIAATSRYLCCLFMLPVYQFLQKNFF